MIGPNSTALVVTGEDRSKMRELVLALASIPDPYDRARILDEVLARRPANENHALIRKLLLALASDPSGGIAGFFDTVLSFLSIPEDPDPSRFRSTVLDFATDLAFYPIIALVITRALVLGRTRVRPCQLNLKQVLAITHLFVAVRKLIRSRFHGKDLERDLIIARSMVQILRYQDSNASNVGRRAPTAFAGGLASAAARLLPVEDRQRYLEEFQAELVDITQAGHGSWSQVTYAAWLLASAPKLRNELRTPHRRRATQ